MMSPIERAAPWHSVQDIQQKIVGRGIHWRPMNV